MNNNYIEVTNDSRFDPSNSNPQGEHHIDKVFISYDKTRRLIVFRQFNIEGFINQYILIDSLSSVSESVFMLGYSHFYSEVKRIKDIVT